MKVIHVNFDQGQYLEQLGLISASKDYEAQYRPNKAQYSMDLTMDAQITQWSRQVAKNQNIHISVINVSLSVDVAPEDSIVIWVEHNLPVFMSPCEGVFRLPVPTSRELRTMKLNRQLAQSLPA